MCVNYYARFKFVINLLPLITAAAHSGSIARVLSVFGAGSEGTVYTDDLDLKHNYTLHACLAHCVLMTDFMVEELAKNNPDVSFMHSYPGSVKSGVTNELTGAVRLAIKVLYAVSSKWLLQVQESGERHLFQMTSSIYPARNGSIGILPNADLNVCMGSDGTRASGAYLLDWDGQATGDTELLQKHRQEGFGATVWNHTFDIFRRAMTQKRSREDGDEPPARIPPGWRAG